MPVRKDCDICGSPVLLAFEQQGILPLQFFLLTGWLCRMVDVYIVLFWEKWGSARVFICPDSRVLMRRYIVLGSDVHNTGDRLHYVC